MVNWFPSDIQWTKRRLLGESCPQVPRNEFELLNRLTCTPCSCYGNAYGILQTTMGFFWVAIIGTGGFRYRRVLSWKPNMPACLSIVLITLNISSFDKVENQKTFGHVCELIGSCSRRPYCFPDSIFLSFKVFFILCFLEHPYFLSFRFVQNHLQSKVKQDLERVQSAYAALKVKEQACFVYTGWRSRLCPVSMLVFGT